MDGELIQEHCPSIDKFIPEWKKLFFQNIPNNNGNNSLWRRFAVLTNKTGNNFLFGDEFKAGKTQGELIYWPQEKTKCVVKSHFMCEITVCSKNRFWITPLNDNIVFVNDVQITRKTELKFGDYLHLGAKPEESVINSELKPGETEKSRLRLLNCFKKRVFLFKERETNPDAFLISKFEVLCEESDRKKSPPPPEITSPLVVKLKKHEIFTPGQNELILSKILSHLSLPDLKKVRFVSHLWNQEVIRHLKKRCILNWDFYQTNYKLPKDSLQIFRYSHEMLPNCPISNLVLTLPSSKPKPKLVYDLDNFFSKSHHGIKSLTLIGFLNSEHVFNFGHQILSKLAHTLEKLSITGTVERNTNKTQSFIFPGLDTISFLNLKKFSVSISEPVQPDRVMNPSQSLPWISTLLKSMASCVKYIHVGGSPRISFDILQQLIQSSSNPKNFPNLKFGGVSVTLEESCQEFVSFLASLKPQTLPIRKIQVKTLGLWNMELDHFEELLRKYANSLECLQITLPPPMSTTSPPCILRCPRIFPKLKRFELSLFHEGVMTQKTLHFDNDALNQDIDYETQFPSLQYLVLWPQNKLLFKTYPAGTTCPEMMDSDIVKYWSYYGAFFDQFLNGGKVCKNLRRLVMPYADTDAELGVNNSHQICPRIVQVSNRFPNVHNVWVNQVRDRDTKNVGSSKRKPEEKKEKATTKTKKIKIVEERTRCKK